MSVISNYLPSVHLCILSPYRHSFSISLSPILHLPPPYFSSIHPQSICCPPVIHLSIYPPPVLHPSFSSHLYFMPLVSKCYQTPVMCRILCKVLWGRSGANQVTLLVKKEEPVLSQAAYVRLCSTSSLAWASCAPLQYNPYSLNGASQAGVHTVPLSLGEPSGRPARSCSMPQKLC